MADEIFISGRPPLKTYDTTIANTSANPIPTTTLSGITTVTDGRQVVTTAGTRVQFPAGAIKAVLITAETDNTDIVVVGGSTVVAALATRRGIPLYPCDSVVIEADDLSDCWLDALTNGDGVTYIALN